MSPENKQRIIGIVILVAFVALLIPFLFTSGIGRKISKPDQIPMHPEQRQLAAEQIENTSNITVIPTEQPVAPAINQSQVTPGVQVSAEADKKSLEAGDLPLLSQAPATANERPSDVSFPPELSNNNQASLPPLPTIQNDAELTNKTSAVVTPELVPGEKQVDKEAAIVMPEPQKKIDEALLVDKMVKKSTNVKAKVKAKNKAKVAPIAPVVNKKNNIVMKKDNIKKTDNWSVQAGSFTNPASVNKLVSQLRSKGFQAYLQKITKNGSTMTRVLVGHEANKQAAGDIANKLSTDLGITGHLVRS